MNKKKNILITGSTGLLGKRLTESLQHKHNIILLVRKIPDQKISNVEYRDVDLSESWEVSELPNNIDIIIHLAQSSRFREFPETALDIFRVNIESTAKLLDYANHINVEKFIYASSGGIYGTGIDEFTENTPITSNSELGYYLGSKLCGEIISQSYSKLMNLIILRFFFMYGEEQNTTMLLPRLVNSVIQKKTITLHGQNGISINPIYVSDAVKAVEKTLGINKSCAFNIAGTEVHTLRNIADIISKYAGVKPVFECLDEEPNNILANIDAMKTHLCVPEIKLSQGISNFFK